MVTETKESESLNTKTYTKLFRDVESFEDLEEYTEFFSVEGSYWQLLKKPFLQNILRSQCTRLENALPLSKCWVCTLVPAQSAILQHSEVTSWSAHSYCLILGGALMPACCAPPSLGLTG